MATWIGHLRIAENLLDKIPGLDAGLFSIGSVSPDSGMPDENWESFEPPTEVTHFKSPVSSDKSRIQDLNFYRKYSSAMSMPTEDLGQLSFLWGYFFHLITDNLWQEEIYMKQPASVMRKMQQEKDFIWEVKKDWYGLDHIYLRDYPNSLYWRVLIPSKYENDFLGFLPSEAISRSIAYIKEYYQRQDDEIQAMMLRPFKYLSKEAMDKFIRESSQKLLRIYFQLSENRVSLEGINSALDLT